MNGLVKADTPPFCKQVAWNWYDLPSSIVIFKWNRFVFSWKGMCADTYVRVCDSRKADSRAGKNVWNPSSTLTVSRRWSQQRKQCKIFFRVGPFRERAKKTTWAWTEILSYVGWVLLGCACVSHPDSLNWFIINSPQLNAFFFFLQGFGKNIRS